MSASFIMSMPRLKPAAIGMASSRLTPWLVMFLMVTLGFQVGCDRQESHGTGVEPPAASLRIVSLSPALTQILKDLGHGEYIVGVGQNDAAAPADAVIVGTYLDINAEALMSLRPTLVLTMSGRDGPPARLKELASDKFLLVDYPYPQTPNEVGDIIIREAEVSRVITAMATAAGGASAASPDDKAQGEAAPVEQGKALPPSIGGLLDVLPQAMNLKYTMLMRLGEISKLTKDQGSPGVLLVIGNSPVMAAGPGTVLDQLLAMSGGRNVAARTNTTAPTFDKEKILELKPDVVLIFEPGGQPLGSIDTDPRLASLRGLDIPAVRYERIVLISDSKSLLPSSTLDKTAGLMAKAVHPVLAEQIDKIMTMSRVELARKNDIEAVSQGTSSGASAPAVGAGSVTNQPAAQPEPAAP